MRIGGSAMRSWLNMPPRPDVPHRVDDPPALLGPDRNRSPAGAGEHDDPTGVVGVDLVERVEQVVDHAERQGVQAVGVVQGHHGDLGPGSCTVTNGSLRSSLT